VRVLAVVSSLDPLRAAAHSRAPRTRFSPGRLPASNSRSLQGGNRLPGSGPVHSPSFEQLRELGLSVTQSARVIAYRETRGGFDSLDEPDEIPGLPRETRVTLKGLLSI
jgi:hypothetical protein